MFEIKNLTKKYKNEFALKGVSLNINKGMNFIVGSSGSGKTTLLKILSGMEEDFSGDVFYGGKNIKDFSEKEKCDYYNNAFGFVWQNFNLLEDLTVLENITLPQYLKKQPNKKMVEKTLKFLKIHLLANEKVSSLSGGEKQRVAIARELLKNPKVIIADEPTSALDRATAIGIMEILKEISKIKTVIVVTHDTSLIDDKSRVFELEKGELLNKNESEEREESKEIKIIQNKLSIKNAFKIASINIKRKFLPFSIGVVSLLLSSILLLTTFSGGINSSGQQAFDDIFNKYGESILNLEIVKSFTSAQGGGNSGKPSGSVEQDTKGLYDKYKNDERVEHIVISQAFENIEVTLENKKYKVESTGSLPNINKLSSGEMPIGDGFEVLISEGLLKQLKLSKDEVLGKKINFDATVYNWNTGSPVEKPISIEATIVGVVDTSTTYEYNSQ
ncbi:MAG: ABC transporter ATP-binding protein, partial [Clostridium sp.]